MSNRKELKYVIHVSINGKNYLWDDLSDNEKNVLRLINRVYSSR
jgi:hypothetical protein